MYKQITVNKQPNGLLADVAMVESGKRPPNMQNGEYPLVGAGGIMGFIDCYNYDYPILTTGRVGTHGVIQRFSNRCWVSDNALVIKSNHYEYIYQFLKKVDYSVLNRGSTQPLITQTDIRNLEIYIPNDIDFDRFDTQSVRIMSLFSDNNREIIELLKVQSLIINSIAIH